MTSEDKKRQQETSEEATKPAGQDISPPRNERVDDEVGSDDEKTTQRQE